MLGGNKEIIGQGDVQDETVSGDKVIEKNEKKEEIKVIIKVNKNMRNMDEKGNK